MKLLIEIDEHNKNVIDRFADGEGCDILPENIFTGLIESVTNGVSIPDNATNGDVIKAMFPSDKGELKDTNDNVLAYILDDLFMLYLSDYWWNKPYKGENNDKSRID